MGRHNAFETTLPGERRGLGPGRTIYRYLTRNRSGTGGKYPCEAVDDLFQPERDDPSALETKRG